MAGDVTDEMNWMLDKLASHAQAHEIVFGDRAVGDYDGQLTPEDVSRIMLTDGSNRGMGAVAFKAQRGTPLEFDWPLAFREAAFDDARRDFAAAKEKLVGDARDGIIEPDSWASMQEAIDELSSELQRQYPLSRFQDDPQEFLVYNAARRFLKAKASMVFQARLAADSTYLAEKNVFEGDSVLDLLQFMAHHGLRFAAPEPGGEGSYRRLFLMMRRVYLQFNGTES